MPPTVCMLAGTRGGVDQTGPISNESFDVGLRLAAAGPNRGKNRVTDNAMFAREPGQATQVTNSLNTNRDPARDGWIVRRSS